MGKWNSIRGLDWILAQHSHIRGWNRNRNDYTIYYDHVIQIRICKSIRVDLIYDWNEDAIPPYTMMLCYSNNLHTPLKSNMRRNNQVCFCMYVQMHSLQRLSKRMLYDSFTIKPCLLFGWWLCGWHISGAPHIAARPMWPTIVADRVHAKVKKGFKMAFSPSISTRIQIPHGMCNAQHQCHDFGFMALFFNGYFRSQTIYIHTMPWNTCFNWALTTWKYA